MKRLLALVPCILLLAVLARLASYTPVLAARPPLVLAFYYDWFNNNIWKPSELPDLPASPYSSRDPQAVARQIQQARGAGIDGFIVSWYGAGNPTDDNFKIMLEQARAAGFSAGVDFEVTSPYYKSRDDVIKSLRNLLATHAHHPAYLRADGKPVIFFWREQNYSVQTWQAIRDAVDPKRESLWIAEGTDTSYLAVFDGHHLYSVGWAQNPASEMSKFRDRVRAAGADKIWVGTAMPGNDDTRTHRKGSYVRDRRGGDFYRETWRGALASSPDWVVITSWNEWYEGTMIEPSVTYGNLYLDITREFAGAFKSGQPVAAAVPRPSATRAPTARPSPTPTLIPNGVRASVTDIVRVRADPGTDAAILGRLREGTSVTLLGRNAEGTWWQIAYPDAKRTGWISAEFTKPADDTSALPLVAGLQARKPVATATPTNPEMTGPPDESTEPSDLAIEEPADVGDQAGDTSFEFALPWLKNILPFLH